MAAVVATYIVAILNLAFWLRLYAAVAPATLNDWAFLAAVFVALIAAAYAVFSLLSLPYVFKLSVAGLMVVCSGAAYFMLEYGGLIDENMIRNMLETDPREVSDLVTLKLAMAVAVFGVGPALLLWRWPVAFRPLLAGSLHRTATAGIALAVGAIAVMSFYEDFTTVTREHRELRLSLTPSNVITGLERNLRKPPAQGPVRAYGEDARKGVGWGSRERRSVTVVVVGETARAANFSLNGYPRKTNPQLEQIAGLVNFTGATSCGTDTAVSVPCIFSGYGRSKFRRERADSRENLLDILQRAGFAVEWRDNQAGCKGVCQRISTERMKDLKPEGLCEGGECLDEALLHGLGDKIDGLQQDAVIVLHMMGSHGPAYYKRSAPQTRAFAPMCETNHISRCSHDEVVNAYDNSILYTDHVLTRLIELLRARPQLDTAMIYASDHGESLGEKGIYLHGMPYAIAPAEQTHVPMMLWLSPAFADDFGIDQGCLAARRNEPVSHDNIFHSVLGMLDVTTSIYAPKLDLVAPCRRPAISGHENGNAG